MNKASLTAGIEYKENKPAISVLLETDHSKELRIAMRSGQLMKEHKTPFPIVVEIFEGEINFGVHGEVLKLIKGDIVALEASIPHDLKAAADSIIRLTLSKSDSSKRVMKVAEGKA